MALAREEETLLREDAERRVEEERARAEEEARLRAEAEQRVAGSPARGAPSTLTALQLRSIGSAGPPAVDVHAGRASR